MLVRCLYASRPSSALEGPELDRILHQSRKNNPALGITGLLCVSDNLFVQVIEGGRDEVCELYNAIVRDPRHQNVRMLSYEEITQRQFGNWTMGQVSIKKLNPSLVLKYFRRLEFDPFECSGAATLSLLNDLVATAAIVNRGD